MEQMARYRKSRKRSNQEASGQMFAVPAADNEIEGQFQKNGRPSFGDS